MDVRVKGLLGSEDGIGLTEQVVHDGTDDTHFGFACGAQSLGACLQKWVPQGSDNGWKVERFAQVAVAGVAKARFALE